MSSRLAIVAVAVLSGLSRPAAAAVVRRVEIKGVAVVKFLYGRHEYAQARLVAYSLLWKDVHGRRGGLFCIPSKKSKRLSRAVWQGPIRGSVLRVGTRAYGFPYLLNVLAGDQQLLSQRIGKDAWQDLRIPLPPELAEDATLVLELVVPEGQRWHEGVFFDYIDFFRN